MWLHDFVLLNTNDQFEQLFSSDENFSDAKNILKPNLQLRHQFLGHLRVGGVRLSCSPRPIMPCRVVSSRPGGVPGGPPECRRRVAPHVHHVGSLDLHHALLQPFHFSLHCPGKSRVLKFIFFALSVQIFSPHG